MKASIEVANRAEADMIRDGLKNPKLRALVKIVGALDGMDDMEQVRLLSRASEMLGLPIDDD